MEAVEAGEVVEAMDAAGAVQVVYAGGGSALLQIAALLLQRHWCVAARW